MKNFRAFYALFDVHYSFIRSYVTKILNVISNELQMEWKTRDLDASPGQVTYKRCTSLHVSDQQDSETNASSSRLNGTKISIKFSQYNTPPR